MAYVSVYRSEVNVTGTLGTTVNIYRSEVTVVSATANIKIYRSELLAAIPVTAAASPSGTVEPYKPVTLVGGGGSATPSVQTWTQVSGTPVQSLTQTGDTAVIVPAGTYAGDTLIFRYNVDGATADVSVPVYPATEFAIIGGAQVPMQMQLVSST